jgi:hypothetical protein
MGYQMSTRKCKQAINGSFFAMAPRLVYHVLIPVVPQKAVAEVAKMEHL